MSQTPPTTARRFLIVNADDFGLSQRVNSAVIRAHREGVLTSASLMVAQDASEEAIELARETPSLGVGLHLTLTVDRALLPSSRIPLLALANGRFRYGPLTAPLFYTMSRRIRAELRDEMTAQFERFAETGLPWSHVDGHQHLHMLPAIWPDLLDLCDRFGVHRARVPNEEFGGHFRAGGAGPNVNTVADGFLGLVRKRNLAQLRSRGTLGGKAPFVCDRVYGQLQSSNVNAAYVRGLASRLSGHANELFVHPGTDYARRLPRERRRSGVEDVELDALLDPTVRAALEENCVRIGTYAEIEQAVSVEAATRT